MSLVDEWIKRGGVCVCVCARAQYYSTIKRNEILPFATTRMELESIMLSKVSQRKIPYYFTHVEFKKQAKGKRQTKKQTQL